MNKIPIEDLIGKKYGKLTIVAESIPYNYPNGDKYRKMKCLCECGNETEVLLNCLRSSQIKSCGCLLKKHGFSEHLLYRVWSNMRIRCYDSKNPNYKNYGARGITICKEWDDVNVFIKWALNHGWRKGLVIDRINNDEDYSPKNCHFVTYSMSCCNTRLLKKTNTSGFRGVSWNKRIKKYVAGIRINTIKKHLGYFNTAIEAAKAYDKKARMLNDKRPLNYKVI